MSGQRTNLEKVSLVAALWWLAIPVAWSAATILDRTRVWESSPQQAFMVGWAALVGSGALTLWTIVRVIDRSRVPNGVFVSGFVAFGLGLAISVIAAWALPVWMVLFGVALLLLAPGMGSLRRVTQFTGAAMLAGVAFQIVLTLMNLGTPDS